VGDNLKRVVTELQWHWAWEVASPVIEIFREYLTRMRRTIEREGSYTDLQYQKGQG